MQAAKLSAWNNKWNEIFDFTPNAKKGKNYKIVAERQTGFVSKLSQMMQLIEQIEKAKGSKIE